MKKVKKYEKINKMIFISWAITTQPSFRTHFKVLHIHILTVFYGCDEQLSLDLRKVPFSIYKKLQFSVDRMLWWHSLADLFILACVSAKLFTNSGSKKNPFSNWFSSQLFIRINLAHWRTSTGEICKAAAGKMFNILSNSSLPVFVCVCAGVNKILMQ